MRTTSQTKPDTHGHTHRYSATPRSLETALLRVGLLRVNFETIERVRLYDLANARMVDLKTNTHTHTHTFTRTHTYVHTHTHISQHPRVLHTCFLVGINVARGVQARKGREAVGGDQITVETLHRSLCVWV